MVEDGGREPRSCDDLPVATSKAAAMRSVTGSDHRGVMQEPNGYGAWLLPAEHGDDDDEDDDDDNCDVG